jgi:ATP-dependent Clp protease adaptor protein ClpS
MPLLVFYCLPRQDGFSYLEKRSLQPLLSDTVRVTVSELTGLESADIGADMSDQKQIQHTGDVAVDEVKPKLKKPALYRVILVNDDYTPMEFVVLVLQRFFRKGREEAVQIMLNVHTRGSGICGVFTAEIAETKVRQVLSFSRDNKHPLQCTMEPE